MVKAIINMIPGFRKRIIKEKKYYEKEVAKFPPQPDDKAKREILLDIYQSFDKAYRALLKGHYDVTEEFRGYDFVRPDLGVIGAESRKESYNLYLEEMRVQCSKKWGHNEIEKVKNLRGHSIGMNISD